MNRSLVVWFGLLFLVLGCGRSMMEDGPGVFSDGGEAPAPECTSSAECDDDNACNGVEQCVRGRCAAGAPMNCDDGIACTLDACDPDVADCVHTPDSSRCPFGEVCDPDVGCIGTDPCTTDL